MPSRGNWTGLKGWVCVNLIKLNRVKIKVLHLGRADPNKTTD